MNTSSITIGYTLYFSYLTTHLWEKTWSNNDLTYLMCFLIWRLRSSNIGRDLLLKDWSMCYTLRYRVCFVGTPVTYPGDKKQLDESFDKCNIPGEGGSLLKKYCDGPTCLRSTAIWNDDFAVIVTMQITCSSNIR